jgi:hypothetical protein
LIEIKLAERPQLCNAMVPSPLCDRELNRDVEQFFLSLAKESPRHVPLKLCAHLGKAPEDVSDPTDSRCGGGAELLQLSSRWRPARVPSINARGRLNLVAGTSFLVICESIALVLPVAEDSWHGLLREGLPIIG